jgi:hypothetical protein
MTEAETEDFVSCRWQCVGIGLIRKSARALLRKALLIYSAMLPVARACFR